MKNKQMRISDVHYKVLGQLSNDLGISRAELLGNAIGLIKKLMDNNATSVKIICNGEEKELLLTLLMGHVDAN